MEGLFEKRIKRDRMGVLFLLLIQTAIRKKIVVSTIVENGKDIKLTIDSNLQKNYMNNLKMIRAVQLL